jgi:hypothetical protein
MKHGLHKKISQAILVIFFLTILYTGFVTSVIRYNPNPGSIEEKRSKPQFPVLEMKKPDKFIGAFDKYVADNFGMRYILIDMYAKLRHHVLNVNSAENKILEFLGVE